MPLREVTNCTYIKQIYRRWVSEQKVRNWRCMQTLNEISQATGKGEFYGDNWWACVSTYEHINMQKGLWSKSKYGKVLYTCTWSTCTDAQYAHLKYYLCRICFRFRAGFWVIWIIYRPVFYNGGRFFVFTNNLIKSIILLSKLIPCYKQTQIFRYRCCRRQTHPRKSS